MFRFESDISAAHLLQQILSPYQIGQAEIERLLRYAREQQIEPLTLCAARFHLTEAQLYEQLANLIGLAFFNVVPASRLHMPQVDNVARLSGVKMIRATVLDREVLFMSPGLAKFAQLANQLRQQPHLSQQICVVPPKALQRAVRQVQRPALYRHAVQSLSRIWPRASAHLGLGGVKRFMFLAAVLGVAVLSAWDPPILEILLFVFLALLYVSPASFRLYASLYGLMLGHGRRPKLLGDACLPIYSIMIPLRDEAQLVPQLADALKALNYPPEKLDIKFVVESVSPDTIAAVEQELDYLPFELVEVPDGMPRTKPKAINFALPLVRGDHVVVYDAEDIPHPNQLRLAATLFAQRPDIDCFQAELLIDNSGENALTALFATEYAAQFALIMPALADLNMPVPLGGTSNHFRTASLRYVGGWDSFNVTEDADLGMRLARVGMRCAMLPSATREEAPINIWPWVKQRTRWMKGWMQTLMVHSSELRVLQMQLGWRNFLFFYLYIGGMVFAAPMHGIFLIKFTGEALYYQGELPARLAHAWPYFIVLSMTYGSALISGILGLIRTGKPLLIVYQVLLPLYWVLTPVATLRAAWQLAVDPFSWEKTTHGKTRVQRNLWAKRQNRTKRVLVQLRRVKRQWVAKAKRRATTTD
ncbi:cellulose synthase/poly-beta-1,6-N-acetylglucosamine synthase-like glycosyltransferase [Maritalea mobilis]|uniref:Cellulose synthase/poly-beta-1,6-N-acetylglucosamine synthase-like glycosyltransferase n=1 Tax=Maritalea mobilis TaxID=483324 RepID=A0A4R6VKR4_9HYPH|nr:glycosyltransferase [Maritalea mobilis]TDQ64138.1 cellulose synthase/poly-beta-1,6-N-acetylglucosamine synthase-like glycosyltransferase [Maritalea mobilis]